MGLHVMDTQHGAFHGPGQTSRHRGPHQQRPGEPRAAGVGDSGQITALKARLGQAGLGQRQDALNVIARGELWDHTAIERMGIHLAVKLMGQ